VDRWSVLLFGLLVGCTLDRSGADTDGGATRRDGSVAPCGMGTVDLNGDPADGCECTVAVETCEGTDEDCDGATDEALMQTCGVELGICTTGTQRCAAGSWGTCEGAIEPGTESCDAPDDEDCDGSVDEECPCVGTMSEPCGTDVGACEFGTRTCAGGTWGPCDGGVIATSESCNDADDDCDANTDEGTLLTFYRDADGDSLGTEGDTVMRCSAPAGYIDVAGDCDDGCGVCWSGASEICDAFDNDCNAATTEPYSVFFRDEDGDGFGNPGSMMTGCVAPMGYVEDSTDCDDACASCRPGGAEICDGLDNDCAGGRDDGIAGCTCARVLNGGRTYLFCSGNFTRDTARARCTGAGLDLVSVNDAAEQTFLEGQEDMHLMDEWWLGVARTPSGSSTWRWVDGSGLGYSHWDGGEPNGSGDCARARTNGWWADQSCGTNGPSAACEGL
jgi:hypothetical protein